MLHREKLRQDMREKEREKDKKLKRLEKEERLEADKEKPEVSKFLNLFSWYFKS